MSCSSSSRAWFSALVMVRMTNGRPTVVMPSVSTTTRSLVRANAS